MQHFSLLSSRSGVFCSHLCPCVCMRPLVVTQSELVSPSHGRGRWLLIAVVPNLYKRPQDERRGKPWEICWTGFSKCQAARVGERLQYWRDYGSGCSTWQWGCGDRLGQSWLHSELPLLCLFQVMNSSAV